MFTILPGGSDNSVPDNPAAVIHGPGWAGGTTVLDYAPRTSDPSAAGPVKETELWNRLLDQFGAGYYRVWASEFNLADLDNRTVMQALADGVASKVVWRAVWAALELPARER